MKRLIFIFICLLLFNTSYSFTPKVTENLTLSANLNDNKVELNNNYQQFKFQLVNLESTNFNNFASLKKKRKSNSDNLMLYVAGGLAIATATLILTNNPENFTSNSASSVNLGIAIGGTLGCGMIVAKYLIDKSR